MNPTRKNVTITVDRFLLMQVIEGAEVRQGQWAAVANGEDPTDTILELFETEQGEAMQIAVDQKRAINLVRSALLIGEGRP